MSNYHPQPHAFHLNLPPQFFDDDGVPTVTKFAARKAKQLVDLVFSIELKESMFEHHNGDNMEVVVENGEVDPEDYSEEYLDEDDEDQEIPVPFATDGPPDSLLSVSQRCGRLLSLLTTLENLKFSGISQSVTMDMVLHLLRIVTATVKFQEGQASLYFENVGAVLNFNGADRSTPSSGDMNYKVAPSEEILAEELTQSFALPSPTREVLLLALINIISNKGPLRSVSNASIYPVSDDKDDAATNRSLLILHWKPLLRLLLRTAPYLDEHAMGNLVNDSSSRTSAILKRTVQLIRDARHFFEQGVRPPLHESNDLLDHTAKEIWSMVREDVLFHSHTHACYRGSILLYLFQPTRCSQEYYLEVLPLWWEAWTNIDRCPEYDFLWLALFCRARKHVKDYDWSPIRKRLLTHSQYWLQLPIGGAAMDTSFPRAANPRSRSCPPRLKVFAGSGSSYNEGIDFVAKVAKLIVSGLGTGDTTDMGPGRPPVTEGTNDILVFLSFVTPYFNPSNLGQWTFTLGAFLHYFAYELCCRLGAAAGNDVLRRSKPRLLEALIQVQSGSHCSDIPAHEFVALMDTLLPLCQQTLYSKNSHVGRAGEAAMLYLIQIDPAHSTPSFIDFACRALDISAVNLSHQAPAALSALTRLIQPALRSDPSILLSRLPDLLRLSLAGIDSNDQNKTIRTLILYRSLASWIPVGRQSAIQGVENQDQTMDETEGTMRLGEHLYDTILKSRQSDQYVSAWESLPSTSLLKLGVSDHPIDEDMMQLLVEEASSAMSDWALEFLERVFGLLRASGEREKTSKRVSGVASRHSSADVQQARNFSRVLKECMMQVFAAMDDETHQLAVRVVIKFLREETLPTAAKDASLLCQAVAASGFGGQQKSGLDELVAVLTDDFLQHSTKTVTYRLRCLAGAVRSASHQVVKHRKSIGSAISFALSSTDRHLFKTGCKLLRHTLSTLVESYPLLSDSRPKNAAQTNSLGKSAQLCGDRVQWHVPDKDSIEFAWELLNSHVVQRLESLCMNIGTSEKEIRSKLLNTLDVLELRRCLRVVRYAIRGGASVLLDSMATPPRSEDFIPYEKACYTVINAASEDVRRSLFLVRGRLCSFLVVLSSIIASETLYPDGMSELMESDPYRKVLPLISSDPKVCKETSDLSLLLLTRRGAAFRSQEARTILKAQKQLASDFMLCALVDHMSEFLQNASLYGDTETILYKDGEDGGKTIPRRLLVARVQLFHDSLQRNASFEIPRRLRIHERNAKTLRNRLFSVKSNFPLMVKNLESLLTSPVPSSLDAYEGIADGLYALCCHSNAQVRASALSVIDYTMTRFGWLVAVRVPRLLSGLSLNDQGMNGKFGIPSCSALVGNLNQQGKRKKLAEAVKGVCSILSLSRAMKHVLQSAKLRNQFATTVCGTDTLISLLPTEEMQQFVHYLQAVFSPFRSKVFHQLRVSPTEIANHKATLQFALDVLSEKGVESSAEIDDEGVTESVAAVHWRKMLLACWFLLSIIDENDLISDDGCIATRAWSTCVRILETEKGQPLQRVGLGFFGRLVHMCSSVDTTKLLRGKMRTEAFCRAFGEALAYDHKEDTSIGGGHDAQWATGVEDIIRDSARNIAPRTLFPFQRTSQALGAFKSSHAHLVERVLAKLDSETAALSIQHLLNFAKDAANSPPSEDQRNEQITAAEIFGGVCGSFLRSPVDTYPFKWDVLLSHLDDVMGKIPFSLSGAYFDAIRYALQFCPPSSFFPLTKWLVEKIRSTLWHPSSDKNQSDEMDTTRNNGSTSAQSTEGFTAQSKWLYLFTAVLIEMDESEAGSPSASQWYKRFLTKDSAISDGIAPSVDPELEASWKLVIDNLLPRLTAALGHPFDSCRDHISRCLFRICYCHRKMERKQASLEPRKANGTMDIDDDMVADSDPGALVVKTLAALETNKGWTFTDRYNALSTARRFISYSVHLGEAKFEYSDYVIPLLKLAFETIKSTVEEEIKDEGLENQEENAAKRALEAEVIKAYRCTVAEVSITAVISYGKQSDMTKVLDVVDAACKHAKWQVRHAAMHFLRCFQDAHKFLLTDDDSARTMCIVADILADERREVSSAGMAALTGILAASTVADVTPLVARYITMAGKSTMKREKKGATTKPDPTNKVELEDKQAQDQKTSVFFLCAAIMSQPYETPPFVPPALAAISKHSFERNAPLGVRDTVKRCCADYKKTHMSDNWEVHRSAFSQEQLEALEDVIASHPTMSPSKHPGSAGRGGSFPSRSLSPPRTMHDGIRSQRQPQPSMMFIRRSNTRLGTESLKIVDIIQAALDILDEPLEDAVTLDSNSSAGRRSDEDSESSL